MITRFEDGGNPPVSGIGTKALELMRLMAEGFAVPRGFVLETGFFDPWIERLADAPEWKTLLAGDEALTRQGLDALKLRCMDFTLAPDRNRMLQDGLSGMQKAGGGATCTFETGN